MNHDASDKHVLAKSSEGDQNKLCIYVRQPQLDRTGLHTHSLTHSQWCVGRTGVQDSTPPMQPFEIDEE